MKLRIKCILSRAFSWLRRHRGEIIYYSCVLGALTLIALGAEQYRSGKPAPEPVSLPAAQIIPAQPEEIRFRLPEGMKLLQAYSAQPLWNEQDRSWQAHPAADYTSEDGSVRAFAGGTVIEMGRSAYLGGYVLVESGEVQLKYCCVEPEDLETGKEVRMGELLGQAADTMPGELHLGTHLHLEARSGGEYIDPEGLLSAGD